MANGGGDLWVRGGDVVVADGREGPVRADVLVRAGRIAAVGADLGAPAGTAELDASGLLVLPGSIDPQVHFREPGLEHKEDLASGALAAVAGGVTAFCEMPNTRPATTTRALLEDKLARAAGRAWADHAFFVGATAENVDQLAELEALPGCAGVKVFMGSSTGDLLVRDDATLERVLRSGRRRVTVHSEDDFRLSERYAAITAGTPVSAHHHVRDVEAAVRATRRLLDLVERTRRPVHVLHVSTADEVELIAERDLGELVTFEITPNHLFLEAPGCYAGEHGSWAQMNPPVRERRHQERLRRALADGEAACVGSDHAPHTVEEKAKPYPTSPSGVPGVQTTLALLLTAIADGWLDWSGYLRATNSGPRRVYGIQDKGTIEPGADADLVLVDRAIRGPLEDGWLRSRARTNPFVGRALAGWPVVTILRGEVVYRHGHPTGAPARHRRSALVLGCALGTLPDLDALPLALLEDPVAQMVWHRSASHSLLVLPLVGWALWAALVRLWRPVREARGRWFLAVQATLVTHPLLDALTIYGTQLWWPLRPPPVMVGSVFIIDPLYTVWLAAGVLVAWSLRERHPATLALAGGLVVSTAYLGWSLVAKALVEREAATALGELGLADAPRFSVPTPFNTLLWRVVAMTEDGYVEGTWSLVADDRPMRFVHYPSDVEALRAAGDVLAVRRLAWFNRGFMKAEIEDGRLVVSDLRMGAEPDYVFAFEVAERTGDGWAAVPPVQRAWPREALAHLGALWDRIWTPLGG